MSRSAFVGYARLAAPVLGLALSIAACDDDARATANDDDDGGAGAQAGSGPGSGGSGVGGAGSGGAGATTASGGSEPIPTCLGACAAPADCDLGAGPAYDADNYACVSGGCVYQGCNSDAECQTLGNYVCRDGYGIETCVIACATPTDCDLGSGPAYDADNYACVNGGCIYQGCNDDAECQTLGNYLCRDGGAGTSFCYQACATPTDCDLGAGPAYDADNYACTEGACLYAGCNSTSECMSQGDYVCGTP